jgi:hypothetical protein
MTACLLYGIVTSELPKMCPNNCQHRASIKDKFCPECGTLLVEHSLPNLLTVIPYREIQSNKYFIVGQIVLTVIKDAPQNVFEGRYKLVTEDSKNRIHKVLLDLGYKDTPELFLAEM